MQFQSTKNLKKIFHTNLEKISGDTAFTSELDYYHQNKNVELLHELANNVKLGILGNFKKILEIPGIKDKCSVDHLKSKL